MKKLIPLFLFTPLLCLFGSPFGDITVNDLEKAIKEKKVAILDVNGAGSYRRGHVPGAIEFSANQSNLASLLPKDKSTLEQIEKYEQIRRAHMFFRLNGFDSVEG